MGWITKTNKKPKKGTVTAVGAGTRFVVNPATWREYRTCRMMCPCRKRHNIASYQRLGRAGRDCDNVTMTCLALRKPCGEL